ncbi:MAG: hypothetical protein WAN50_00110 [Minisyncoccia bacterium]
MKASLIIASSRDEVAQDAPWAKIIAPIEGLKDGIAYDTQEALEYTLANRAKFLPGIGDDKV